ncbi:aminotransferase class I/II-fold pyridoxal phosphate-dependent enzyme [Nocardia bovistercoris]|uniref:Aminotransferase class I/II-fold pyridoxal phosphate-dependent enzyme n=1 Tax=Nocardia bovistercoris TaxID=2785916 RepID=A0A931N1Y1_9NOCA|nr:aminotransferase class I/II-fold pyridoxal phosphate-dependent enzyme [Nocardia bovistercoris]MBH0778910.1 aminotransferase class I/II-fold pyridoxal phosphate-dependent enzyme [Nocardia bovistercoris]
MNAVGRSAADLREVVDRSEARKRVVRARLRDDLGFAGTRGRGYAGVVDAYHGDTGLAMAEAAAAAREVAWKEVNESEFPPGYGDPDYDKRQPRRLLEAAAHRMFAALSRPAPDVPGVRVEPDQVVVAPYSSTLLLEEVVAQLASRCPGGALVCPEMFYKNAPLHVAKSGLRIERSAVTADDAARIDPVALAELLARLSNAGELAGVLLTLPGNPVVADYTTRELLDIGRVLVDSGARVVCDMAFDHLVAGHVPIAAMRVPTAHGEVAMFDRVLTVTGNSKGYNASGPTKIGAACTGDARWLGEVRERLTIAFQRETTHLAAAVIENTPDAYFEANRALAQRQQRRALRRIAEINRCDRIAARFGPAALRPLGSGHGMFSTIEFAPEVLAAAGIEDTPQLEDLLLAVAGIDSVGLLRTGSERAAVRLNVLTPRNRHTPARTDDGEPVQRRVSVLDEMFDRLERVLLDIADGRTYAEAVASRGLTPLAAMGGGRIAR